MWTFLAIAVPVVLWLPTVMLCVLFPGPARAAWSRVAGRQVRPEPAQEREGELSGTALDDAAIRAYLQGPPSAVDTCDRCAMSAVAAVYLPGGRLLLCGHHGRQYQSVLQTQGAVIVGELAFPGRTATSAGRPAT